MMRALLLIPLLVVPVVHGITLHIYIYGQGVNAFLYVNGSFLSVSRNDTVEVPNGTVQLFVNSFDPSSKVFINGVQTDNLTFLPWRVNNINITSEPTYYFLEIKVVGPGHVVVRFENSSQVETNETLKIKVVAGTILTIVGVPNSGYSVNWSGGLSGSQIWYIVYNNANLTAQFVKSSVVKTTNVGLSFSGIGLLAVIGGVYWFTRRR
ncbi:hypothetical protein GWK48_08695 [Metallosphaera tengchongensis]|uniref:Uncharacterized protein n=1 Tax=Metallosphaera tengchongensis TaxID=1532350 RepID=A0A6N0NXX3_9CREN|nr:hypothetical protein [Metallosphaera tengchongensis]QKR00439.1 hypothetical protein GWK48_08695 [Metallosphaera tengchongensis]